jgi:hypothetical protein
MWLRLGSPLLLALACCGVSDESELCATRHESYRVTVSVRMLESSETTSEPVEQAPAGRLLVSVSEDSSILSCGAGLVAEATPGTELISKLRVTAQTLPFALEIPATVYPELHTPELWMNVLWDENGNGACDDGEPTGVARVEREEDSHVQVVLSRQNCFARL